MLKDKCIKIIVKNIVKTFLKIVKKHVPKMKMFEKKCHILKNI